MSTTQEISTRTITVRVAEEVHEDLSLLSRVTGTSISEHVRAAVVLYVFNRTYSETIHEEIAAAKKRFQNQLEETLTGRQVGPSHSVPGRGSKPTGLPLSIRLDNVQESRLKGIALLDDNSLAEQIRSALDEYLKQERNGELFASTREIVKQAEQKLLSVFPKVDPSENLVSPDVTEVLWDRFIPEGDSVFGVNENLGWGVRSINSSRK